MSELLETVEDDLIYTFNTFGRVGKLYGFGKKFLGTLRDVLMGCPLRVTPRDSLYPFNSNRNREFGGKRPSNNLVN
jgi:hypothetical protein